MATKPEDEDETLDLTEDMEIDEPDGEEVPGDDEPPPKVEEEETVIGFDDSGEDQPEDSSVIRQLRAELRETKKRLRESATEPQKITVREKPTLASCDYDEEKFEIEHDAYKSELAQAEAQKQQRSEAEREVKEAWQRDVTAFQAKRAALSASVPDMDELQQTVEATLDLVQQAALVKAANDPALFMVAAAKNPAKLAELAKIRDPIKFAAMVARMEGGIKVTKRMGPAIDRPQSGSGKTPEKGDRDKQLEKLEKEADRTGNRTALIQFKKKHGL